MSVALEAPAPVGHNNPPEPTPYEAVKVHIEDLCVEARNWADGAVIENEAQAGQVARLIDDFRKAEAAADNARKAEAKPHDDAKAEIQGRYNLLIGDTKAVRGKTVLALAALKATLTPWLRKVDEEKRAVAEAARLEAEAKAEAAAAALRAADVTNLAAREEAEAQLADAHDAQAAANRAANDKAHAHGGGRAIGLRRTYRPQMTDRKAALIHYAAARTDALVAFLQGLAEADVREGKRSIPGFDVIEEATV